MKFFSIQIFLVSLLSIGCTNQCEKNHKDMTAEEVIKEYIEIAFNMESVEEKEDLMELTTDELEAALGKATLETIKSAYIDHRYHLKSFSVVQRFDKTPRESDLTYEITYKEKKPEDKDFENAPEVTAENTAIMIKENDRWLIKDVIAERSEIEFPITDFNSISANPKK